MSLDHQKGGVMSRCVIGVPKEVKPEEGRVGITPDGVHDLCALGVEVIVETDAGKLSGFSDGDYLASGATVASRVESIYREATAIVKVKELIPEEYRLIPFLRHKVLFTYLHLAGVDPRLTVLLLEHEVTAITYENVTRMVDGRTTFPLLVPMSKIAGTQAMRGALARYPKERRRELEVIILGGGNVGEAALVEALLSDVSSVGVFETAEERRAQLEDLYRTKLSASFLPFSALNTWGRTKLTNADVVISGVMLPGGAAAPKVLTQKHFRCMRQGAYIADVTIDQGDSTAWSKVTKPGETYTRGKRGLVFSCVPNIPGSTVPREATLALTKETFPFVALLGTSVLEYGSGGVWCALKANKDLRAGLQTYGGHVTNAFVAEKHGLQSKYQELDRTF